MTEKKFTIGELASLVNGEIIGDEGLGVSGLTDLDSAGPDQIAFLVDPKMVDRLEASAAAAIIVPLEITTSGKTIIRVPKPYLAAAIIHNHLLRCAFVGRGIDPRAVVGSDCRMSGEVSIGPLAVIGDRVTIGNRVEIKAGSVIGSDVEIGDDTLIHPNVTVLDGSIIGRRVILHSGVVIGADGYGYATDEAGRHIKRPQVGNVRIDDDVEIGANTCVDRATFGTTHIKQGVKIDNLVMIGHNAVIGEHSLLVSQSGVAGSARLGKWVIVGGQAGIAGHVEVGDKVMVAGQSGVAASVKAGETVSGMPAIAHKNWLRASIVFAKLPELLKDVRELKKKFSELIDK